MWVEDLCLQIDFDQSCRRVSGTPELNYHCARHSAKVASGSPPCQLGGEGRTQANKD